MFSPIWLIASLIQFVRAFYSSHKISDAISTCGTILLFIFLDARNDIYVFAGFMYILSMIMPVKTRLIPAIMLVGLDKQWPSIVFMVVTIFSWVITLVTS